MGLSCLGDRIFLLEMVSYLKKKKIDVSRSQSLWSGQMPADGCPYKRNCTELCCPEFFYGPTKWRVTGQGIFYKDEPSCCFCCGTGLLLFAFSPTHIYFFHFFSFESFCAIVELC